MHGLLRSAVSRNATIQQCLHHHAACNNAKFAHMQELKNIQLGHLFMHDALLQSGRLSTPEAKAASVSALLDLAAARSFMAEACVTVVLSACDRMESAQVAALVGACEPLFELVSTSAEAASPEALQAALHLWPHLPEATRKRCQLLPDCPGASPTLFVSNGECGRASQDDAAAAAFFKPQHLHQLLDVVRQSSGTMPRLHSMWQHLLCLLLPGFRLRAGPDEKSSSSAQRCAGSCKNIMVLCACMT